ncbi:MAG: hypothetical protein ACI87O_001219, partial [Planctomycetota bacterium]
FRVASGSQVEYPRGLDGASLANNAPPHDCQGPISESPMPRVSLDSKGLVIDSLRNTAWRPPALLKTVIAANRTAKQSSRNPKENVSIADLLLAGGLATFVLPINIGLAPKN